MAQRVVCLALALACGIGGAGGIEASERDKIFRQQTRFLDTRGASQYNDSAKLIPRTAWDAPIVLNLPKGGNSALRKAYLPVAQAAARRHGVPEALFARLVQQESAWNPGAVSQKGALGLAQLMPDTARLMGVDPKDPYQNLDGGAKYLRKQYERFGSWRLALAAYNAGPEAVARHGGVPPYAETQTYVARILADLG